MNTDIKVSVCVITYNQEKYIAQTLESILSQKTNFNYEVIIHDDASTDSTCDIIKEYQIKYPDKIKPIFQEINQYSVNIHLPFISCWQAAKGDFIALCEGDDYWLTTDKLQQQYDLIKISNTDLCFTDAVAEYADGSQKTFLNKKKLSTRYSLDEIVRGGGAGMATASIMIKSDILKFLPDWFVKAPVGDYFIQILGSVRNGAICLNEPTAAYRVAAVGSWSSSRLSISEEKIKLEAKKYVSIFEELSMGILSKKQANYAVANELYYLGALCIKKRSFPLAFKLIGQSWNKHSFVSLKQSTLYFLSLVFGFFYVK